MCREYLCKLEDNYIYNIVRVAKEVEEDETKRST